jgi:hypothetical protein
MQYDLGPVLPQLEPIAPLPPRPTLWPPRRDRVVLVVAGFVALTLYALIVLLWWTQSAKAHDHYSGWKRPDDGGSCCSGKDCYQTQARYSVDGWIAMRREDGKALLIPDGKIVNYAVPDGMARLCAAPPGTGDHVYCFRPPQGGM